MGHTGRHSGFWVGVFGVLWLVVAATAARADRIVFRGGGQIRGKVLPDPKNPARVQVLAEHGKTPFSFLKTKISEVIPEASPLDDYLKRRDAAPLTAEGQFALGQWCESKKLPDLAENHYEAALTQDKAFAPAHLKLGHVLRGDRWLKGDELRKDQGLVLYRGKWITPEEKARHDQVSAHAAEQATWVRRIRQLREAFVYGAGDRKREAETSLMEIRDPIAVAALVKVLGTDDAPLRVLLARLLGAIPGPEAATALAWRLVDENEPDVRSATLDVLERRKDPEVSRRLVQALRSSVPEVVNRAAWALASLNHLPAVPSLVNALVSVRQEMVMAPSTGGPVGGGAISATFGTGPLVPYGNSPIGAPIGYNGSSIAYMTPPAVGPGVVAMGAVSLPAYPIGPTPPVGPGGSYDASLAGVGINGGGGLNGTRGPMPRLLSYSVQNTEVLAALVKLTGQNFGYDVSSWKQWLRTSFKAELVPARRVQQP